MNGEIRYNRRKAVLGHIIMRKKFPAFVFLALTVMASAADGPSLTNGVLRADFRPEWGGRLMFFGKTDGVNALWTAPGNATLTNDWKNVGGEKTWVGYDEKWRDVDPAHRRWPPPVFFDSDPFDVVALSPTSIVMRSRPGGGGWGVLVEREAVLREDRLLLTSRLVPTGGEISLPREDLWNWSVVQIPYVSSVLAVPADGTAFSLDAPELKHDGVSVETVCSSDPGATELKLNFDRKTMHSKVGFDSDSLRARTPAGLLVLSHKAAPEFLAGRARGLRAMVCRASSDYLPEETRDYLELEFSCTGAGSEQTVEFELR